MSVMPKWRDSVVKRESLAAAAAFFFPVELPKFFPRDLWLFSSDTYAPARKAAIKLPHSKRGFSLPNPRFFFYSFFKHRSFF